MSVRLKEIWNDKTKQNKSYNITGKLIQTKSKLKINENIFKISTHN